MEASVCINCHKPKARFKCGLCDSTVCKSCIQFLDESHFSFMMGVPSELTHGRYCGPCFDEKINPQLLAYDLKVEKAKQVHVFYVDDAAETRLFNRQSKPLVVDSRVDKYSALMTLAYMAVDAGHNTLVDVQTAFETVDLGGYRTSKWSARGTPVTIKDFIPNRKARIIGKAHVPS
jgi:hypothetical protein